MKRQINDSISGNSTDSDLESSIGLIAIFSGSEDQNIVLSAILFFQCVSIYM